MSRRSLTFRLVSWYCGLLLALGAAFAIFTYASFDRYVTQTMRSTLAGRADAVWGMAVGLLNDKAALSAVIEQRFAPEALDRLIRVRGSEVYYQSGIPSDGEFDPSTITAAPAGAQDSFEKRGNLFLYAKTFAAPDGTRVTIESGQSDDLMAKFEHRLVVVLIFGLPVLLIVAAAGGFVLVQRALSPVQGMIEAAEAMTFNSPRKRLPLAGTEDRIDALGRTLNRMLERLDGSYQHAARFSADAAHELRTPLAIMRGELELLATEELSDELQRAVANILGETERLGQIVDNLMAMAQLDTVTGKRAHHPVDVTALTNETIDQMRLMAVDKDIAIAQPKGGPAMAVGDRDRLKQVLVNLLDNAIKYTPPGGRIDVAVEEAAGAVLLTVSDSGIGIAAADLPHVFDRFFRATTDRGEVGAGLGLAIVKAICAAHGGTVTVDSTPGAGSCFKVTLPQATSALIAAASVEQEAAA
jgi:signal transduction histidine kinase